MSVRRRPEPRRGRDEVFDAERHAGRVLGMGDIVALVEEVQKGVDLDAAKKVADKLKSAGFSRVDARYSYGWPGKISWRLSMKFPILALGASKLLFVLLPFYYLLVYPVCFVLNAVDIAIKHHTGTGLIVKAWK